MSMNQRRAFPVVLALILILTLFTTGCIPLPSSSPEAAPPKPTKPTTPAPPPVPPADLVEYDGKLEHLFFHPLLAYPQRAWDGPQKDGFDMYSITVPEFNRIIQSLYDKGFILVHIHDFYQEVMVNGQPQIQRKKLMLPKGKKPIILSIDDLSYYRDDQLKYGTVSKLVLDQNGEIATLSTDDFGQQVVRRDNEIVPILDDFVKQHPDFSYNGAKGTINLTGFDGILGYRTNSKIYDHATRRYDIINPDMDAERIAVQPIIAQLKATGWDFASHTYYHWPNATITMARLQKDATQWNAEVGSLVGPTDVYVFPQGSAFPYRGGKGPFVDYAYSLGFRYFEGVGETTYEQNFGRVLFEDRRHADGIALRTQRRYFLDLFDANEVFDPATRPAHVSYTSGP